MANRSTHTLDRFTLSDCSLFVESNRFGTYLTFILAGAAPSSAAAAVGLPIKTHSKWLTLGRRDQDPACISLYQKTIEAIGQATVQAEAEIKERDPKWWAINGPRMLLYDGFYGSSIPDPQVDQIEQEIDEGGEDSITQQQLMETLSELRKAGLSIDAMVDAWMGGKAQIAFRTEESSDEREAVASVFGDGQAGLLNTSRERIPD